jgi:hypothetical protein
MPAPKAGMPATDDDESTVRGRVIARDGIGWNRTTITVGENSVRADADGGFVVHGVPKSYDVRIGQTMFLGLTRRDPVLVVGGNYHPQSMRYHAAITDGVSTQIVSNQGRWARRVLQFLAPGVATGAREGEGRYGHEREIGWRGDHTVTGLFVSLMNDGPENDPWASGFLATETLSLTDGDSIAAAPRLLKIGSGRIAGTVSLRGPAWPSQTPETLRFSYVVPGTTGSIDLGTCRPSNGRFDCRLPDLSALGGEYCMAIGVGEDLTSQRVSRCGGRLGMRDFSEPAVPAPPVMRHGSAVDQDTMIAWTGEGHVFEVMIGPAIYPEAPIRIFTAKHSLSWSDFLALGMNWNAFERISDNTMETRAGRPTIDVYSVGSVHPYQSIDDLISARHPLVQGASWQKAPSPRGANPSEKGIVAVPQYVATRLQAVKGPVEQPLDLFHLPTCTSTDGATPIADIRPSMTETRVSVRGTLTWNGDWACTMMGCDCCNHCGTTWIVTDPKVPGNGMLLHPTGHRGNLGMGVKECEIPKTTPAIDVIATGLLLPSFRVAGEPRYHRYVLDEATVCAVKRD